MKNQIDPEIEVTEIEEEQEEIWTPNDAEEELEVEEMPDDLTNQQQEEPEQPPDFPPEDMPVPATHPDYEEPDPPYDDEEALLKQFIHFLNSDDDEIEIEPADEEAEEDGEIWIIADNPDKEDSDG
jgi:hypothetical protein